MQCFTQYHVLNTQQWIWTLRICGSATSNPPSQPKKAQNGKEPKLPVPEVDLKSSLQLSFAALDYTIVSTPLNL